MNIGKYTLVNDDKAERVINGTMGRGGQLVGGVGAGASDEVKLAAYDRLGGLVRLNGDNVKKGSFYDFKARAPRAEAQVMLVFKINGKDVEVPADEPLPPLVRAAKAVEQGEEGAEEESSEAEEAETKPRRRGKKTSTESEDEG